MKLSFCFSHLAISESKNDQLEKEVEILKQELLQARQAGNYSNALCDILEVSLLLAVHRTESQTNMMHQKQQQQRDMAVPQNKPAGGKHEFVVRSFEAPTRCDHCSSVMIGLVRQGMVCKSKYFTLDVIYVTIVK